MDNMVGDRDGGSSQGALGSHRIAHGASVGLTSSICPVWGEVGREVPVLWRGESCWTHLLAGQLILHLFSPRPTCQFQYYQ